MRHYRRYLSPGGRAGKIPSISAACAKGKHTNCTRENCTCTDCGHPAPVEYAEKKMPQRDFVLDSISETVAS